MENTDIIKVQDVSYFYTSKHCAVQNISFSVAKGEIFSIIGSNGSGKSTLLHLISGLHFPHQGKIFFKNHEISEHTLKNKTYNSQFRASLGYVFQNTDVQLFCPTVMDELLFGPLQMGMEETVARSHAQEILNLLHIESLHDRPTYMLSGGEKKRVAIGAALTMNPEVLLIDEPVSGLDPKSRAQLIELIFALNEAGKTIVLTTHHLELVDHFQSRVAVLSEQHTLEKTGTTDEILSDTELLMRVNLMSEYPHRHGNVMHKHAAPGFLFHKHQR